VRFLPPPSSSPLTWGFIRHTLNCLVQNEPGVLSRVSGILAGRGFNIDSLVVCRTEIRDLSRMCIVLSGQDGVVEQARRQLEDLVCPLPPPSFLYVPTDLVRRSRYGPSWITQKLVA
jgi:acetolactate synthase regulatory subunit